MAESAKALTPAANVTPGESITVPASSGWEVILDVCGQIGTIGPTGSSVQIVPENVAEVAGIDPNTLLDPSANIGVHVSPAVTPGLVIGISWTTFHDGCFSAHGGITLTVVDSGGGGGAPGTTPQTPTGAPGAKKQAQTKKTKKKAKKKRKGILNEKAQRALDRGSKNLVGYAENAGSLGGLCAFSNIKKQAIEKTVKLVAKDLAQSQIPVLGQIPTDACSFTMSAFTGWLYIEAYAFDKLAKDPPQPRYRRTVRARVRIPFAVTATGDLAPLATRLNAALAGVARSRAYLEALLDANERLQGAERRHDRKWTRRQRAAAKRFALKTAAELKRLPARFAAIAAALRKAGYVDRAPTPNEVGLLRDQFSRGLPAGMRSTMSVLGVPKSNLKQIAGGIAAADPYAAGFPGVLESPATAHVLNDAASELRQIGR
jgi:hypothetical protein